MAPPLVTRLPKVTEYVKNVGKSVQYATVDYFKGSMENTSDFIENNQELFKDIAAAVKDYKGTLKAADRSIKKSKIYEAGTELKKTLFESIRTGKFYDPEREAYYQGKASGSLGDMSDMDDWGFDTNQFDIDSGDMSQEDSTNILSSTVKDATTAQATVIAKSSEYLAEMDKANTRLLFAQGEKTYAAVSGGFAGTQSMLDQINKFLQGPLTTHMENSKTFYEQTNKVLNEMNANLKELTEMQRNLYKREQARVEESQFSKVGTSPDLKEYGKQLYKNFMEILGPEAQMVLGNDMGEGSNMLMALVANPLAAIPQFIVKSIVPATIKKSLETLDASFSNLFANFIARMNKAAGSDNIVLQYLGRLFGLKIDKKTTYDSSKYEKGPVPFDGITRKTIVDIIPGHLARIEAALTGKTERVFDYETGKWTTADKLERDFRDRKRRNVRDAFWDSGEEARDNINRYKRSKDKAARERGAKLEQAYETIINKIYEDGGVFEPYRPVGSGDMKQDPWTYYGIDKETFLLIANWIIGSADDVKQGKRKKSAYSIAPNVMQAQESFARYMRDMENKGYGNVRHLYNNAYDFSEKTGSKTGTRFSNIINESFDKYGKNVFWYLRGIYAELQEIRKRGGTGGNYRPYYNRGSGPKGPTAGGGDPLKNIEAQWDAEITSAAEKTKAEEEAKNTGSEDTDVSMLDREVQDQRDIKKGGAIGKKVNNFLDDLLKAGSLGQKFKVIQEGINELTKKPSRALVSVIEQADIQVFRLLFGGKEGQEIVDQDGNRVRGMLDYMVLKTRETFDKMNDWLDENILNPFKEKLGVKSFGELFKRMADKVGLTKVATTVRDKVKDWARPTVDRIKEKMGWGWGQFKGSMGRTYGAAWNKAKANFAQSGPTTNVRTSNEDYLTVMEWLRNGEITDDEARELLDAQNFMGPMAHGGLVTRRGLAVISPGEKVVPVGGKVTQRNNLTAEKAFARRLSLPRGLSFYATGTDSSGISDEELNKVKETVQTVTSEVLGDTKHKGVANVIASSLIGGGVSLLTGMIGGPLLGAAVGAAFGITQNSGTVQRILFGEDLVDKDGNPTGEKAGGLISKDIQDKAKKYFPSMRDFGLAGAVAGLFTPLGLVGGLMAGSAIGFAKENDQFQEWMFGKKNEKGERDGGLIKKEFRDKVKKAAPRMLIGAAGGALLGPFGLLGNAVLGSALGFATTTNGFHEFVFGKEDGHGKRKGGLIPAIQRGILKPLLATGKKFIVASKEFFDKKIAKPVTEAVPAIIQMVKNGIVGIGDHVKDFLSKMFQNTIGRPLADFLEHTIFDNVRKWMGRLLKAPLALAKGIISAPFSALGFVGRNIRATQMAKGTASDMSAQQRLNWRNEHRFRMFGKEIIGHDRFRNLDEKLVGYQGQRGIDEMKEMRTQINLYLSTRKELGRQAAELVKDAGEVVSDFFNNTMCEDDPTMTLYQAVGSKRVKRIHEAIKDGKVGPIQKELNWMVLEGYLRADKIPGFINSLSTYIAKIAELHEKQKDVNKVQRGALSKLSKWSGGTLRKTKNIRRFSRLLDKEIDVREAEEAKAKATQEAEDATPEGKLNATIAESTEKFYKKTDTIIDVLRNINAYMAIQAGDTNIRDILKDTKPGAGLSKRLGKRVKAVLSPTDASGKPMDDVITGDRKSIIDKVNSGLHTIETDDGEQGLVDSSGNVQPTRSSSKIKKWLNRKKDDKEQNKSFLERLNTGLFGKLAKGVTGILGTAKDGLFGLFGSALSVFEPAFKVLKWVFLGTTAVAAIGHGTGWLEEKVFPWLRDKVAPWLIGTRNEDGVLVGGLRGLIFGNKTGEGGTYEDGLISGLTNTFVSWWNETPIAKFFKEIQGRIEYRGGFINWIKSDVVDTVFNWYVDGIDKFIDKLLLPMVEAIVTHLPDIIAKVGGGIFRGVGNWFGGGGESTSYTSTDSSGNVVLSGSSAPANTKSTTVGKTTASGTLKLTNNAKVTFFTDEKGNTVFVDSATANSYNPRYIIQDKTTGVYTYADTGEVVPQGTAMELAKSNSYATSSSSATLPGMLVSGAGNVFMATASGLRGALPKAAKTFGAKGMVKNFRKALNILNPIGAAWNAAKLGGKGVYNATATTGNIFQNLGAKFRDWAYEATGKEAPSKVAQKAAEEAAEGGAKSTSLWSRIKSLFRKGGDDAVTAATAADAAADAATGAAATATKSGGILSRITSTISSIGSSAKNALGNTAIGKAFTSAKDAVGNALTSAKDALKGGWDDLVNKITNTSVAKGIAGAADDAVGLLAKVKNGILNFFNGIANNKVVTKLISGVAKIFGTTVDDAMIALGFKEAGEAFVKKIGDNAAKSALKSLANSLASVPLVGIAMAIGYFVSGWDNTHNIFGIARDIEIPVVYNVVAGLVNAVKNCLPGIGIILAFIDTATMVDIFANKILPAFGWDNSSLKKLRDQSQKILDEANSKLDEEDRYVSIEEYNNKVHPTFLKQVGDTVGAIGSGIWNGAKTVGSGIASGAKAVGNAIGSGLSSAWNWLTGGNRKRRSGRYRGYGFARDNHLYQGDPKLENVKFGNSTLGKAGCAPIAAANLMGSNLEYATQAAIPYQTSDGGVTPDYFTNTLGGAQTSNKKALSKAIKSGRPTVLLGNSGTEQGTPFGANDHYITAMGMDRRGNIIVEDPDLPGSSYKYPASRVMRDTTTGVITGMRRAVRGRSRRKRRYGFAREGGDYTDQKQTVSKIVVKAYDIIHESEGNYNSVNKDDNGAMSIGKIQWHAGRAKDLLRRVINAVGESSAKSALGTSLYNDIMSDSSWKYRVASASEADKIGKFISTEAGKQIQDMLGYADIEQYIEDGKSRGLKDENVLVFYADMYNQSPAAAQRVAKNAVAASGGGNVTLDTIYNVAITDKTFSKYSKRRTQCYNKLKGSAKVGNGTVTLDMAAVNTFMGSSTGSSSTVIAGVDYTGIGSKSWSQRLEQASYGLNSAIFGSTLTNAIGTLQTYNDAGSNGYGYTGSYMPITSGVSGSSITVPTNGYGTVGSPTQQGVVNQMASINGKIAYSLDWDKQDPDKGYASCASTVGWAYRKALGVTDPNMSANSGDQSKDSRFTTIWTSKGETFNQDNLLQPGDVMYFNWDRPNKGNNGVMQHTEMYAGNGYDWSHGGNPHMGPVKKELNDYRRKRLMMVRRYNGFMQSGSSRRRGYARSMTSGVNANISDNAKRIISQYGISTSNESPRYGNVYASEGAAYNQFLSVIIDLLAAIADNTKGLADLQKALVNRGVDVDYSTLEKAAANARRRAAKARQKNSGDGGYRPMFTPASNFSASDAQDLMNSPTGFMVQAMEALAIE